MSNEPSAALCFRIDAVPMPTDRMISGGHQSTVAVPLDEWAAILAVHCRVSRPEYRNLPIRVMVWPHRGENERYRTPPPPSPISRSFSFRAGLPDWTTHRCSQCSAGDDEPQESDVTWTARRCLCEDRVTGERDCYCFEAPRCTCDECQPQADAGRAERLGGDSDYTGVWL